MPGTQTVVVFFARTSRSEVKRKTLDHNLSFAENIKLISSIRSTALTRIQQSGLPYIVFDESMQTGNSFGDKFFNAIRFCIQQGYSNFILTGNDCPDLETSDIIEAAEKLNEGKATIGPDKRGGFYLIGLNKSMCELLKFDELPWSTPTLLSETLQALSELSVETFLLRSKSDLNTSADFKSILNRKLLSFLNSLHAVIIQEEYSSANSSSSLQSLIWSSAAKHRGPPINC